MGWFRRRRPVEPEPTPPTATTTPQVSPDRRPTAAAQPTSADETPRAEGYRNAAHKAASVRGKAARAACTPADNIARAQEVGMVARADYLTPEAETDALRPGPDGLLNARLERVRDRLLVVTPTGWVNPKSRIAHLTGLDSFTVRGTGYHPGAVKAGKFTPGTPVRLIREPDNPHDPNAIAIYAETGRNRAGYVPAARAKRLAKLLDADAGADLVAVSVRGSGRGTDGPAPHILICERRLFEHLIRP